jgi:hypothetical protein
MISTPDITLELAGPSQLEELMPLVSAYHDFEDVESSLDSGEVRSQDCCGTNLSARYG